MTRLPQPAPITAARKATSDTLPFLNPDGSIRQPGRVSTAEWRDIEDGAAMERDPTGRRGQRTIRGYRAIDPLDRLPCEPHHRRAAAKLRADWERGSGATSGGGGERVDAAPTLDRQAGQIEARRGYEQAVRALGPRAAALVLPVVLSGWTVADLVSHSRVAGNPMAMQGRVMAGLDRLVEHYWPQKDAPIPEPPPLVEVDGMPAERVGRWR